MNALLASYDSDSGDSEELAVQAPKKQKKERSFAVADGSRVVAQVDFFSNPEVEDSSDDSGDDECAVVILLGMRQTTVRSVCRLGKQSETYFVPLALAEMTRRQKTGDE
jgi:hypothetical protein